MGAHDTVQSAAAPTRRAREGHFHARAHGRSNSTVYADCIGAHVRAATIFARLGRRRSARREKAAPPGCAELAEFKTAEREGSTGGDAQVTTAALRRTAQLK